MAADTAIETMASKPLSIFGGYFLPRANYRRGRLASDTSVVPGFCGERLAGLAVLSFRVAASGEPLTKLRPGSCFLCLSLRVAACSRPKSGLQAHARALIAVLGSNSHLLRSLCLSREAGILGIVGVLAAHQFVLDCSKLPLVL